MNEHNRVIELLYDDKQIIITPADLERQGLNMIGHYGLYKLIPALTFYLKTKTGSSIDDLYFITFSILLRLFPPIIYTLAFSSYTASWASKFSTGKAKFILRKFENNMVYISTNRHAASNIEDMLLNAFSEQQVSIINSIHWKVLTCYSCHHKLTFSPRNSQHSKYLVLCPICEKNTIFHNLIIKNVNN